MLARKKKNYDFKIDGVNIYTLLSEQDFKLMQEKRMELVKELLYDEDGNLIPYLEHFFDGTKNNGVSIFCPSSIQPLSLDINVCAGLETLANYILYSPDGKQLNEKTEYNFYTDKKEFKKRMSELSLNHFEDVDDSIDFLEDTCRNYLLETNQKVYAHDLKKVSRFKGI